MEVVWELTHTTGSKRQRSAKACVDCKRRKKKCPHSRWISRQRHCQPASAGHPSTSYVDMTIDEYQEQADSPIDVEEPSSLSDEPIKVGDYHAESLLIEIASESPEDIAPRRTATNNRTQHSSSVTQLVGLENTESPRCVETIHRHAQRVAYDLQVERKAWVADHYSSASGTYKTLSLPRDTQDALVTTYISSLDTLIPIVDGRKLLRDYTLGSASQYLINAICLTACKTKQGSPYLRLSEDGPALSPRAFAAAIYNDLEVAMRLDLEPNRLTKIRILALMWFHHDDHQGMQKSSAYLSQAIHDAFVICLHFEDADRLDRSACSHLWWTLRVLDRQNACLQGVPLVISDRDVDLSPPALQSDSRSHIAVISSKLGDLMDEVMEIYRPRLQRMGKTMLDEFPTFTEIVSVADLSRLQESHRDYLEIWYLVLGMLSCRFSPPGTVPYERRFQSADRVRHLTAYERHETLPPLPIIPYAVSLSLTVMWRALKDRPHAAEELTAGIALLQSTLQQLAKWSPKAAEMNTLSQRLILRLRAPWISNNSISLGQANDRHEKVTRPVQQRVAVVSGAQSTPSALSGIASSPRTNDEEPTSYITPPFAEDISGPRSAAEIDIGSTFCGRGDMDSSLSLGFGGNVEGLEALMVPGMFDFFQLDHLLNTDTHT